MFDLKLTNIIKAIRKDYLLARKPYLLILLVISILFTIVEVLTKEDYSELRVFWVYFGFFMTVFQIHAKSDFEKINMSLPITRAEDVVARYLSLFSSFIFAFLYGYIWQYLLFQAKLTPELVLIPFAEVFTLTGIMAVFMGIFMVFFYKSGNYLKAFLLSFGIAFVSMLLLIKFLGEDPELVVMEMVSPYFIGSLGYLIHFVTAIPAIYFYRKRDI